MATIRYSNSILVPLATWLFLIEEWITKKGKEFTDRKREWYTTQFNNRNHNGLKQVTDYDWGFSVEEMKQMFDDANLPYEDGSVVKVIDL